MLPLVAATLNHSTVDMQAGDSPERPRRIGVFVNRDNLVAEMRLRTQFSGFVSQRFSASCAYDASTCWGDHSGALYW